MKSHELIKKYLEFFKSKNHKIIPSAPLIPENDPSTLFNTAGMQPLVPFLLGQAHPQGKRLVNVQKCIRTGDIDEVGDNTHLTFFEMLGNWSLGDYFKKEAISWSFEFLIKELNIDIKKINVTVFKGDKDTPKDIETYNTWKSLGISEERIFFFDKSENWWGLETGPCGPDTEIFIDTDVSPCGKDCSPACSCGKYIEIWNNVFMEYNKTKDGKLLPLKQKNVDTGMGFSRIVAIIQGKSSVYETDVFKPYFEIMGLKTNNKSARIIIDHIRAATMILGDEHNVIPSKSDQGYLLRRLIRRAVRHCKLLNINPEIMLTISKKVMAYYKERYPIVLQKKDFIVSELKKEINKFLETLDKGIKKFEKLSKGKKELSAKFAFLLFQSFGFPIELTKELCEEKGIKLDEEGFNQEFKKHQELSRKGANQKFKGGLASNSIETTKLHTVTHLLAEALRKILDKNIVQKGSNINSERLRFDFNFDRKVSREELDKIEELVNEQIKKNLSITREEMTPTQAKEKGAQGEFKNKYGDKVFVYSIGDFSKEICGGPHVKNTKELSNFKIVKEKSISAGVRRIKAILK